MKTRLLAFWEPVRSSFWFVPLLMAGIAVGLSFAMIALDNALADEVGKRMRLIWLGSAEGARELLSTIAGSMITVAGVVFSITIVSLSLASSQFGPRLLRNFMRDPGNQIVLGTFISTYLYCLLVLRTVRGGDTSEFVPSIAVTMAIALAIVSLGVLIYFIHHVSRSIQATTIIAAVGQDLDDAIARLFPEKLGQELSEQGRPWEESLPKHFECEACPIPAENSGYVQAIDSDTLMRIATENDLILRIQHRPGHFAMPGSTLALVWPGERVDRELVEQINDAFFLGSERTLTQDVEFAINQLVEVAARALSPGTNDPFTAITCIDRLGAALCLLAQRKMPSPYRYDEEYKLRVIADPVTFAGAADAAFNQIRQYGCSSVAVTIRLLEVIARVAAHIKRTEDRTALLRQAVMIERGSRENVAEEWDRKDIMERFQTVMQELRQGADT